MIYFFADDHYGAHPGKVIYECLPEELRRGICFSENDWQVLESGAWVTDCQLLILNLIGETCNLPHPDSNAERYVKEYLTRGGNLLLLHGSSAAFWQWEWWRTITGLRWVRPGDPDGVAPSTHPRHPYRVAVSKSRHPLTQQLKPFELIEDEIYTELENTSPFIPLMETRVEEGTFVQCCETVSPWGGKIVSFIPGHRSECTSHPGLLENIGAIIRYLCAD